MKFTNREKNSSVHPFCFNLSLEQLFGSVRKLSYIVMLINMDGAIGDDFLLGEKVIQIRILKYILLLIYRSDGAFAMNKIFQNENSLQLLSIARFQ